MSDITRFCAPRDVHEWIRKPMRNEGYLYATNGHIAVRMPDDSRVDACVPEERAKVIDLFDRAAAGDFTWFDVPEITNDLDCSCCHGTGRTATCPECGGEGEFERGKHTYECQECCCYGEVSTDGHSTSAAYCYVCCGTGLHEYGGEDIGQERYAKRYLALIGELFPGAQIGVPAEEGAAAMWRCGDVVGLLMPMRK